MIETNVKRYRFLHKNTRYYSKGRIDRAEILKKTYEFYKFMSSILFLSKGNRFPIYFKQALQKIKLTPLEL